MRSCQWGEWPWELGYTVDFSVKEDVDAINDFLVKNRLAPKRLKSDATAADHRRVVSEDNKTGGLQEKQMQCIMQRRQQQIEVRVEVPQAVLKIGAALRNQN